MTMQDLQALQACRVLSMAAFNKLQRIQTALDGFGEGKLDEWKGHLNVFMEAKGYKNIEWGLRTAETNA